MSFPRMQEIIRTEQSSFPMDWKAEFSKHLQQEEIQEEEEDQCENILKKYP